MSESNQSSNEKHDAQGRWYELLSPTQVLTGPVPDNVPTTRKEHKKRTSHGNRKEQHKTRRRQQPMDQTIIEVTYSFRIIIMHFLIIFNVSL
jgi:hypothetical protein